MEFQYAGSYNVYRMSTSKTGGVGRYALNLTRELRDYRSAISDCGFQYAWFLDPGICPLREKIVLGSSAIYLHSHLGICSQKKYIRYGLFTALRCVA